MDNGARALAGEHRPDGRMGLSSTPPRALTQPRARPDVKMRSTFTDFDPTLTTRARKQVNVLLSGMRRAIEVSHHRGTENTEDGTKQKTPGRYHFQRRRTVRRSFQRRRHLSAVVREAKENQLTSSQLSSLNHELTIERQRAHPQSQPRATPEVSEHLQTQR
jgi:hypothetical protein